MAHDPTRINKYVVRDDERHNAIYEHLFCIECRSKECNNASHNRIELHPIIRIPKKRANKKQWARFFELIEFFETDNIRTNRHTSNRNYHTLSSE